MGKQPEHEVDGVVASEVVEHQESLQVRCRATIDRFANAEVVGGTIEQTIREQVEHTLGRPVERVTVRVEPQKAGAPLRVG